MFDISFSELALIGVIALLVLGPERMPKALRTLGLWVGRMSRTFQAMKTEIEREIGMDEIRQQLHNEAVMDQIKRLEREARGETETPGTPAVPTPQNADVRSADAPSAARSAPTSIDEKSKP